MRSGKKIVRLFSRLNVGGPSLHVVNLSACLNRHGYETVLAVGTPDQSEGSMSDFAERRGISPVFIPEFQAAIRPWDDLVAAWKIFRLLRRERPLIVHTHTFKAGLLGRLAARLAGVPIVVHTYHGHLLNGYWGQTGTAILRTLERILGLLSNHVIAVSPRVAQDIQAAKVVPAQKMSVIELGFDMPFLESDLAEPSTLRQKLGIPSDAVVIAIVGRLVAVKNVDLFLESLIPLLIEFPKLHLVVAGDGPEKARLQQLAEERIRDLASRTDGVDCRRVHFPGFLRPMIQQWKDIDLCLCTSRNEGTSVSIIEAVIAEVEVMSTAVGGMPDLLQGGRIGDLLPESAPEIRSRVRLWLDGDRRSNQESATAAALFRERFDLTRLTEDVDALYRRLISTLPPRETRGNL